MGGASAAHNSKNGPHDRKRHAAVPHLKNVRTRSSPSAQELPEQVHNAVMAVAGVTACDVETVWDPPWDPSRMSEEARLQLNMF